MKIVRLQSPIEVVEHWPELKLGFAELSKNSKQEFKEDEVFQTLQFMAGLEDKTFIVVAYEGMKLLSFLVAFDSTPLFQERRVFTLYALLHRPSHIRVTRKLINAFELWALPLGCQAVYMATRRYSKASLNMFSRLGFRRESLLLTKEF
jgi:hypothetical protein